MKSNANVFLHVSIKIVFLFLSQEFIPSELGGCCFPFCECQHPHFTTQHIVLTFSSMTCFMGTGLFSLPHSVLCGLFIMIYFTNHADATLCSFTAAVNVGCSAESLIMPLNEENRDRLLFPSRPNASFSCPLPAVTMAKPFHSSQPSNPPRLAAFECSTS